MPHALLNTLLLEEYCNIFLGKTAFAFKKDNLIQKPRGLILFSHPLHDPAILTHPSRSDQGQDWTCHHTRTYSSRTSLSHSCPRWIKKKKKKKSPFCLLVITPGLLAGRQPTTWIYWGHLIQETRRSPSGGRRREPPIRARPCGAASSKWTWHCFLQRETLPLPTV